MKVSQRAQAVPPSATIAVTNRAKEMKAQGLDVLGFAAGEPDFDTPDFIKEAAIDALEKGQTKYTPAAGTPELRKAIAEKLKNENGLDYKFNQIVVNLGAKHSVFMSMQAVLDPGDEVLLPTPYWVTYPETIKLAQAKAVILETSAETGYKITPAQLKAAITDKTALLVLNSPNNPGGFCYSPDELKALAKVLEGTKVMVISDEIYERLVYGDNTFLSFAAISEDAYNRTLTINGLSKSFSMTGWRLGYTAGPVDVIKAMSQMQDHMTQNPVSFTQPAAIAALKDTTGAVEKMRVEFEKRGVFMAEKLNAIDGVQCAAPQGAFYCFPDVSAHYGRTIGGVTLTNSMDFAAALLEQALVAVVPGDPFGSPKNIRLSFACSMQQIEKGIARIHEWLK
ncbi:MAG: pyridoxal phosphate-dependent aminotransferase [Phycisphaerae bacterium]|nr:pyridoxal phosphate-dependent aminotransferase [Phycisphaerae bacterium]